jgi:hypothetical protein
LYLGVDPQTPDVGLRPHAPHSGHRFARPTYVAFALRWPHLTAEVVSTDRDPFSNNRNLPAFLAWLEKAAER